MGMADSPRRALRRSTLASHGVEAEPLCWGFSPSLEMADCAFTQPAASAALYSEVVCSDGIGRMAAASMTNLWGQHPQVSMLGRPRLFPVSLPGDLRAPHGRAPNAR